MLDQVVLSPQIVEEGYVTAEHVAGGSNPLSRRREVGSASARSLLLTILGEFALPRQEPVWTATILDALALHDVEERAARQALSRTSSEGLLASSRHGRRSAWELTDSGVELLTEGAERIYGFMRSAPAWDGRWLTLAVSIPETQRKLRHRLRTRFTWLGLGSPQSGLWITPDTSKVEGVRRVVDELGLTGQAFSWVGEASGIGDEKSLVSSAWDLADVESRYLDFLGLFSERRAESAVDAFAAQVALVQEWRRFPFLDPDLPRELLDHEWPGPRAAAVFHDRHSQWHRRAQARWDELQADAAQRI
ncbi:PaaX family transcriptional regulator [Gordonia sp. HY285]|uniref:PaaX family transcriptional regulator n=1 Tax=Gordonia liuliyuniae TaxID=2911517 RepID=UPI001F191320|nr:PaaX family transcriptional regulator C-terminal domain-containing protein [Gordonia liuliyuniae]MCF8612139.1 PaaX family transcriptional regulator [Gordonia liuliyuniae]